MDPYPAIYCVNLKANPYTSIEFHYLICTLQNFV